MSDESARMFAAQAAIRAGKKQQARDFLKEELEHNPQNFRAWLWLGGLADSSQESLDYVREAARLNPRDPGVQKALTWAEQRLVRSKAPASRVAVAGTTLVDQPSPGPTRKDEKVAAQDFDALREKQRTADGEGRSGRGKLLLAALVVFVIALTATALLWRDNARQLLARTPIDNGVLVDVTTVTATPTPRPQQYEQQDSQVESVSFVSGHFSPVAQNSAPADEGATAVEATATPVPMQPKPVSKTSNNPRPTWTLTPSPTYTPTATPTPAPTFVGEQLAIVGGAARPSGVGPDERWIDVNLSAQRLVAYEGDRAVFDSLVSSGTWLHPTVTGQFRVWLRYTAQTMDGRRLGYDYYLPNVPYVMYFYRDYALHGTYWHNNFGTPMSHGCVNLPTPAAEWIFNWSSIGTLVNVHY